MLTYGNADTTRAAPKLGNGQLVDVNVEHLSPYFETAFGKANPLLGHWGR